VGRACWPAVTCVCIYIYRTHTHMYYLTLYCVKNRREFASSVGRGRRFYLFTTHNTMQYNIYVCINRQECVHHRAKSPSTRKRLHPQDFVHPPPLRWPRSRADALPAHNGPRSNNIMAETSLQRHAPTSTRPSHCRAPVAPFALAVVPSSFHQRPRLSTRRRLLRGELSSHRGAHARLRVCW
jgi:hypothetical protein